MRAHRDWPLIPMYPLKIVSGEFGTNPGLKGHVDAVDYVVTTCKVRRSYKVHARKPLRYSSILPAVKCIFVDRGTPTVRGRLTLGVRSESSCRSHRIVFATISYVDH